MAYQVFGTAIEVARLGARFPPVLHISGDNALGSGAELQPPVAGFQAQRGTEPRNVYFRTQTETHPRRLGEQLGGVWALLELFGEWGHGLRLGAFALSGAVRALRVVLALLARFQALQVIFEIVEKTHLLSRYDSRVSDFRTRLKVLSHGLLRLHKALLELERAAYERDVAPITSTGQYLNLVLDDPAFQWLRELSAFIVMIDEMLTQKAPPATHEDAERLIAEARVLLSPAEEGIGFARAYFDIMQRDADAILAHRDMLQVMNGLLA